MGIRGNCRCGVWSQKGEKEAASDVGNRHRKSPHSRQLSGAQQKPSQQFLPVRQNGGPKAKWSTGQDKSKRRVWISDCAGEPALSVYNRISDKRKRYPIINQRKNLHYSEKRARHGETRKEKVVLCKARKKDRFEKEAQTCKDSPTWTIKKVWLTSSSTSGIGTLTWAFTEG